MSIRDVWCVIREMGPGWLAWRTLYEAELRSGLMRKRFRPASVDRLLARSLGVKASDLDHYVFERWRQTDSHFFLDRDLSRYRVGIANPRRVLEIADAALEGKFLFFSHWWAVLGNPPDWLLNPLNGVRYSGDTHWSLILDLSPELGDIKYVWEASRFSHVYYFVRAYALTGDERYAEGFWRNIESWIEANPPELGPNWRCGQEIAIRSFAWIFGFYSFRNCRASTPERVALLLKHLWYNAVHIERNHWYALRCVRNNHSLSEAAGLFTIGTLFPFFRESPRWRRKGFNHLVREAMWQIYPDGTYVQHSTNYSRLVVQLFTWCLRVGQLNGFDFPEPLQKRLLKLISFLVSVQDLRTRRVPNYGPNDGALLFPLSSCDYLDYRPAMNALHLTITGQRLYERGPWDEEAAWFCRPSFLEPPVTSPQPSRLSNISSVASNAVFARTSTALPSECLRSSRSLHFPVGGYYVLRGRETFGMVRCGKHRHRPAHADMLHLDVWFGSHNVLVDPGTFSYNLPGKWASYFVGTGSHNTVTVDERDQMKKGPRFVRTRWVHGHMLRFETGKGQTVFEGQHEGYAPVIHRRLVVLHDDVWVVIDDLFGDHATHRYTLHWLLGDFCLTRYSCGADIIIGALPDSEPSEYIEDASDDIRQDGPGSRYLSTLERNSPHAQSSYFTDGRVVLLRTVCSDPVHADWVWADENVPRGWQSLYYGEKIPAWSYQARVEKAGPVRFATLLGPLDQMASLGVTESNLNIEHVIAMLGTWGIAL